jgi:hypothetical protein
MAAAHELTVRKLDWMAWELVYAHKPTLMSQAIVSVEALGKGMASWPESDGFGMLLAGPAWLQAGICDADVARWARSRDLWWRRAALVATTGLNSRSRGGRGDPGRTRLLKCSWTTAKT